MTEPASTAPSGRPIKRLARLHRSTVIDTAILVAAWLVSSARTFRFGIGFDDVTYTVPAQKVTLEAWRHGRMALWSDTIFGGTPQLGNVQTAALYPGHLLSAPFPDLVGPHVELAVHLLLFGVGFYLLGRRLGFARPAPAAMAVAAMWSGATVFRSTLVVHFPPLAWVPLAALCMHSVVTSQRPRRAVAALAAILWCILVSGHPQSVLMAFTLLGAWAVGLLIEHRQWRRARLFAASGALSLAMAAPVLFALRQSIAAAAAASRDEAVLLSPEFVMPLRVFPRMLLGEPLKQTFVLYGQGERITYAGVTIVALGLIGAVVVALTRRWSLVALALVGAFTATLSLGPRSPTMRFARAFLPGFDQPRVSARWNWVLVMTLIVLAGAGIDRLRKGTYGAGAIAVLAAAAAVALSFFAGVDDGGPTDTLFWLAAVGLVVALALVPQRRFRAALAAAVSLVAVFELGMPLARMIDEGNADVTDTAQLIGPTERWLAMQPGLTLQLINGNQDGPYLVNGLRPNAGTLTGVRTIDGYDGGVSISRRWHAALLQINPTHNDYVFGAQLPYVLDPAAFARLGVHYVLYDPARGPAEDSLPGWQHRPSDGYFQVYENPFWHGEVTAWFQTRQVATPEEAGNTLRISRAAYGEVGFVESDAAVLSCTQPCPPAYFNSTSAYSGDRAAEVQLDAPAIVAFDEQFDEGWQVTVDGKDATVVAVDGMWAGVRVPAGTHHIQLRYAPGWLVPSIVIMVLAWLGAAAICWLPRPLRRERSAPATTHDAPVADTA
ncbi:MAG: YfhO family protein [Ilumatobacteraceae bacterium]